MKAFATLLVLMLPRRAGPARYVSEAMSRTGWRLSLRPFC